MRRLEGVCASDHRRPVVWRAVKWRSGCSVAAFSTCSLVLVQLAGRLRGDVRRTIAREVGRKRGVERFTGELSSSCELLLCLASTALFLFPCYRPASMIVSTIEICKTGRGVSMALCLLGRAPPACASLGRGTRTWSGHRPCVYSGMSEEGRQTRFVQGNPLSLLLLRPFLLYVVQLYPSCGHHSSELRVEIRHTDLPVDMRDLRHLFRS